MREVNVAIADDNERILDMLGEIIRARPGFESDRKS